MKKQIILGLSIFSLSALAAEVQNSTPVFKTAGEIESACRIKAKEIAAETYRRCVTDQKTSQIEQIKKEYADKLNALKAHYEQELKKLSSQAKAKAESAAAPVEAQAVAPKKATKPTQVAAKPKAVKKAPEVVSKSSNVEDKSTSEMTVQLKAAPGEPAGDESVLDLPEPIPVEDSSL